MRAEMDEFKASLRDYRDTIQYTELRLEKTLENYAEVDRRYKRLLLDSLHTAVSREADYGLRTTAGLIN